MKLAREEAQCQSAPAGGSTEEGEAMGCKPNRDGGSDPSLPCHLTFLISFLHAEDRTQGSVQARHGAGCSASDFLILHRLSSLGDGPT